MTPRTVSLRTIDHATIASPCPMRWDDLERTDVDGDVVRHCHACDLHVYNFSNMREDEVERVLRETEGRVCAGFFRRADGTIITKNCPVGLRAARVRLARTAGRVAAAIGVLVTGGVLLGRGNDNTSTRLRHSRPFSDLCERLSPSSPVGRFVMGEMCVTPAPANPPQGRTPTQAPGIDH